MYRPTARVLTVLELLQTHRRLTGAELAQKLEVNIRTLRRYITILQDMGIPIVAEHGRYGAYELVAGRRIPPLIFTNAEVLALALGLLAAGQLSLSEVTPAIESARSKLERMFPPELQNQFRALAEAVNLNWDSNPPRLSGEVVLKLGQAIQQRRRVRMIYRSGEGDETEREFDPYGLAYHEGRWYAAGWCHLRKDLRSFRLDRMARVDLIDETFELPAQFDVLAHVTRAIAEMPRRYPFDILLKTDIGSAALESADALGALESIEGDTRLHGSTDDLDWLARRLAGFSFDFVVHEPDALQIALRKLGERLAGK
jgi:predicted DNA-binding transcriptional regulator YafY